MEADVKAYTIKHLMEQLALLEDHLKELAAGADEVFCLDCELKHIVSLSGYAQECIGFKCEPFNIIKELKKWSDDLAFNLKELNKDTVDKVIEKARYFRKELGQAFLSLDNHLKE